VTAPAIDALGSALKEEPGSDVVKVVANGSVKNEVAEQVDALQASTQPAEALEVKQIAEAQGAVVPKIHGGPLRPEPIGTP
jgi:hypothetical protein